VALVTSRDSLAGLVARDGAQRLFLDRLSVPEGVSLLREVLGADRVDGQDDACAELVRLCAGLPLALRIAAELAARRSSATLADLVADLAASTRTLDLLDAAGDPLTDVRAVFSWSYRALPEAAARLFRLLGLHPGPDLDAWAAARLAGLPMADTQRLLGLLADAHLVESVAEGRYGIHDLLREYAAQLVDTVESAGEQQAAADRLLDWCGHSVHAAMDQAWPHRRKPAGPLPAAASTGPEFDGSEAATAWLDSERAFLVGAVRLAAGRGRPELACHLAQDLWPYFYARRHLDDWFDTHEQALTAARGMGDARAQAELLHSLGIANDASSRYDRALDSFEQALPLRRAVGDLRGEAATRSAIGNAHYRLRNLELALEHYQQALTVRQAAGDRLGEEVTLSNIALVLGDLGRYREAIALLHQGLTINREFANERSQAWLLSNLGRLHLRLGEYATALAHLHGAREIGERLKDSRVLGVAGGNLALAYGRVADWATAEQYGLRGLETSRLSADRNDEIGALNALGWLRLRQGDPHGALARFREALAVSQEHHEPGNEHELHNGLGETLLALGDHGAALEHHRLALAFARGTERFEYARAECGTGLAMAAAGQSDPAREHVEQALGIFTELGVPEADALRERLAAQRGEAPAAGPAPQSLARVRHPR
jgi:tetratricopeptide (TPR) repeat protein